MGASHGLLIAVMMCSTNGTPLTNTELTLDELKAVSGVKGGRTGYIRAEIRGRRSVADYPPSSVFVSKAPLVLVARLFCALRA